MNKTLSRSSTDRKISGVCGGIAEYLNVDSTIIRIAFVLIVLAGGFGLLLYIIAAIIMPMDYEVDNRHRNNDGYYNAQSANEYKSEQNAADAKENSDNIQSEDNQADGDETKKDFDSDYKNISDKKPLSAAAVIGIVFIAIGAVCLVNIFFPSFNYGVVFALLVVALGVLIIVKGGR